MRQNFRDDYEKGAEYVYNFTKEIIDVTGPRLPGSKSEKIGAEEIAKKFEKATGNKSITEEFMLSPRASIGAIPILGFAGLIVLISFYLSPILSLILSLLTLFFAVVQIFAYTGILDFLFKRQPSQNVYSTIEPSSGKADYTIIYSGHIDSSWNWNHSNKRPLLLIPKTGFGIIGFLLIMAISIVMIAKKHFFLLPKEWNGLNIALYIIPLFTIVGDYWLMRFLSWDEKIASPGAMDNLTGIALSALMAKYFKNNPELQPKNARIICAGLGSEEAGLKGSMAFVKKHKDEEWLKNAYVVNLDSFRDYEHFNVVKGDLWLMSRFDKDMIDMSVESVKESGLKGKIIVNPVGGCDSTPFARAKIKTVTLNAQNPTVTSYYHTYDDKYEDLDMPTLEKSYELVLRLTEKIIDKEAKRTN